MVWFQWIISNCWAYISQQILLLLAYPSDMRRLNKLIIYNIVIISYAKIVYVGYCIYILGNSFKWNLTVKLYNVSITDSPSDYTFFKPWSYCFFITMLVNMASNLLCYTFYVHNFFNIEHVLFNICILA